MFISFIVFLGTAGGHNDSGSSSESSYPIEMDSDIHYPSSKYRSKLLVPNFELVGN